MIRLLLTSVHVIVLCAALTPPAHAVMPDPIFTYEPKSGSAEPDKELIEASGQPWLVPKKPLQLPLPEGAIGPRGAVVVDFVLPSHGTLDAEPRDLEQISGRVFELPFLRGNFFVNRKPGGINDRCAFRLLVPTKDGKEKANQLVLSRLEAGKPYQLVLNWDAEADKLTAFLQGVEQGDMTHWAKETPPMNFKTEGPLTLDGRILHNNEPSLQFAFGKVRIYDRSLTAEEAAALAGEAGLPALAGEGRTIYQTPLDVAGRNLKPLFEESFTQPIDWISEEKLLDADGKRVSTPQARWILEGPKASLETTPDGLVMRTTSPEDRKEGHWVLWLNQPMPDGILVEYEFAPQSDERGLHILFLAAHRRDADGTLFDLDLPARRGDFKPYITGEINSYHISPWAADDQALRRTANMRKNSGFSLVAVGNDRIGGSGSGWHKIRALIENGRVELESDGVLSIQFQDTGQHYGPVWKEGGLIGFRFMAHTGQATLRNLRVWKPE